MTTTPQHDFTEMGEKFFQLEFSPIRMLYIDLGCLQDINLGTLLLNIKEEDDFNYVMEQLPAYNHRLDNKFLSAFPKLKERFSEEDLLAFQKDPANAELIARMSPYTNFTRYLSYIVNSIQSVNSKTLSPVHPWSILFNTHPLAYPLPAAQRVAHIIRKEFPHIKVGFVNKAIPDIDADTWRSCDMLVLNDPVTFCGADSPITSRLLFEKMCWHHKFIFAARRSEDPSMYTSKEDIASSFKVTRDLLCLSAEFDFIDISVLVEDPETA